MTRRRLVAITLRLLCGFALGAALPAAASAAQETLPAIDSITVDKSLRRLYLIKDEKTVRSYEIALGLSPKGHKRREGDYRTPEGS